MVPAIYSTGVYNFAAPYDGLRYGDYKWECIAKDTINALSLEGINVYDTIYAPYGLTMDDYIADSSVNAQIIKLKKVNTVDECLSIPETRIIGIPLDAGVEYVKKVVVIDVGLVPVGTEDVLYSITQELTGLIAAKTGISVNGVSVQDMSATITKSYEHDLLFRNRCNATRSDSSNIFTKLTTQQVLIEKLRDEIKIKDKYILDITAGNTQT